MQEAFINIGLGLFVLTIIVTVSILAAIVLQVAAWLSVSSLRQFSKFIDEIEA